MMNIHCTNRPSFTWVLLLLLLVQLQLGASFPLLSTAFRHTNDHQNNHQDPDQPHRHLHHNAMLKQRHEKQFLAMLKQQHLQDDQQADDQNDQKGQRDDDQQQQQQQLEEPQIIGMRVLNAWGNYWDWVEAETHSVYVFAFTYFGVITLMLIALVILISCCYMFDCMGCYDLPPTAQKCVGAGGGGFAGANTVFPMESTFSVNNTDQQQRINNKTNDSKSAKTSIISFGISRSSSRRWSSPIAQL